VSEAPQSRPNIPVRFKHDIYALEWMGTYNSTAASSIGLQISASSATRASLNISYPDFSSNGACWVPVSAIQI
jgi:hypothetical protein